MPAVGAGRKVDIALGGVGIVRPGDQDLLTDRVHQDIGRTGHGAAVVVQSAPGAPGLAAVVAAREVYVVILLPDQVEAIPTVDSQGWVALRRPGRGRNGHRLGGAPTAATAGAGGQVNVAVRVKPFIAPGCIYPACRVDDQLGTVLAGCGPIIGE